MEPRSNIENVERMEANVPPPSIPLKVKVLTGAKNLLGNNTEHWYQSRLVWIGAGEVLRGVLNGDYYSIVTGLATIIFRILTKNGINFSKALKGK